MKMFIPESRRRSSVAFSRAVFSLVHAINFYEGIYRFCVIRWVLQRSSLFNQDLHIGFKIIYLHGLDTLPF